MQHFSHFTKNSVFFKQRLSLLVDNCAQITCFIVFRFFRNLLELCYMRIKLAPCRYTKVHCANKPGLKGHLPLANLIEFHKWPTGLLLLQQSVLGPKDCSKQWRKICEMDQRKNGGNFRKFPAIIVWYFLLVLRARKTVRVHVFMEMKLVGQEKPSKTKTQCLALCGISTGCSPQHWKPKITFFTRDDIFGLEITFFDWKSAHA